MWTLLVAGTIASSVGTSFTTAAAARTPVSISTMAFFTIAIAIPAMALGPRITAALRARWRDRLLLFYGRRTGTAEEEAPQPHENADLFSGRGRRRSHRFLRNARRRRQACHCARDDRHRCNGLRFIAIGDAVHVDQRLHGKLVADDAVFQQCRFIVAHTADVVGRRLDVLVRNQHDLHAALGLDVVQPFALFVHEIGGDIDRQLRDDLRGAVLAGFLSDQAQDGKCQRLDAADAAHAGAARARDMSGIADRRTQTLPRHLQQSEARQAADLDARTILLDRIAQPVFYGALVLLRQHVDEVDDDEATEIAQTQLPCNLVRRFEVRVESGGFDVAAARGACRVDVDGDQCFRGVNDD